MCCQVSHFHRVPDQLGSLSDDFTLPDVDAWFTVSTLNKSFDWAIFAAANYIASAYTAADTAEDAAKAALCS